MDPQNAGHAELAWTKNFSYGYGLTHGIRLTKATQVELESKYYTLSGWQGHADFHGHWFPKSAPTSDILSLPLGNFLTFLSDSPPDDYHISWRFLWRSHEIINNQRLSILPEFELHTQSLWQGTQIKAAAAYVEEEGRLATQIYRLEAESAPVWAFSETMRTRGSLSARFSQYGNGNRWYRVIAGLDGLWDTGPIRWQLGYAAPLVNAGSSPFLFDTYQVQESPEYRLGFKHRLGYYRFYSAYEITKNKFREFYVKVEQPLHEWRLELSYEAVGGQLAIGFRLADL
jgi:hypothetical protein